MESSASTTAPTAETQVYSNSSGRCSAGSSPVARTSIVVATGYDGNDNGNGGDDDDENCGGVQVRNTKMEIDDFAAMATSSRESDSPDDSTNICMLGRDDDIGSGSPDGSATETNTKYHVAHGTEEMDALLLLASEETNPTGGIGSPDSTHIPIYDNGGRDPDDSGPTNDVCITNAHHNNTGHSYDNCRSNDRPRRHLNRDHSRSLSTSSGEVYLRTGVETHRTFRSAHTHGSAIDVGIEQERS